MSILSDLTNLLEAGVITKDTADKIQDYYNRQSDANPNRLFIVFGILGAILIGLGIILIIAHNWDQLSRGAKTTLAFLPLIAGQLLCGYTLLKKRDNTTWRESSAAFLFFTVGASISLISQVYNIPGNLSSFLLIWMLLTIPLVYVMNSSIVSILCIIGTTYFACESNYWSNPTNGSNMHWLLILTMLPHYYFLYKKRPRSNFTLFHHWLFPLMLTICLGTIADKTEELLFIAYFSLFGLFYLIGNREYFMQQKLRNNSYRVIGSLGTIGILLALSFDEFWEGFRKETYIFNDVLMSTEFLVSVFITAIAIWVLFSQNRNKVLSDIKPLAAVFIFFIPIFALGNFSQIAVFLINLVILLIGILTIREGGQRNHLGVLNFGLLILTALISCRFFDTDLSYVTKGIIFVLLGIGFFVANYWMLKKRSTHD